MTEDTSETPEMMFEKGKRFYLPGSGVADPLLAFYYFNKAAEAGYVPAQRVLGTSYLEGRLVARNYEKARQWLTMAARQNDGQAAYSLALIYVNGWGVDKNWELAYQLLNMECARDLAATRQLKGQLKEELAHRFPNINNRLEKMEKSRRASYSANRHRFIQPWNTQGRPQLENEEFALWLKANQNLIAEQDAFTGLAALMTGYYDEQEAKYPPAS